MDDQYGDIKKDIESDILLILQYIERDNRKGFINRIAKYTAKELKIYNIMVYDYFTKYKRYSLQDLYKLYINNTYIDINTDMPMTKNKKLETNLIDIHIKNCFCVTVRKIFSREDLTDKECSICLDKFRMHHNVSTTICNHVFHKTCLEQWIKTDINHTKCPCCRTIICK